MELLCAGVGSALALFSSVCLGLQCLNNAKPQIPKHVGIVFTLAPPNVPGRLRSGPWLPTVCRSSAGLLSRGQPDPWLPILPTLN